MINDIRSSSLYRGGQRRTKPARRFLRKFLNDWSMDFAAMLAYNLLIALLPIAIALFGILGLFLQNHPNAEKRIIETITNATAFDNTTRQGIQQILDLAFDRLHKDAGFVLAIGIVFALFGASRLFIAVDKCMTIVYRLPERTFLRQNMLAIGMIFLFIILIPLMIAASSAPTALLSVIPGGGGSVGTYLAGMIFSLLTAFVFFEAIYWFVPNKKMSLKTTWCGSLVAAGTMELFIILFPLYVRNFMGNYAGSVGFAVIFLIFLFYFATILILGAQVNAFFFENYKPLSTGLGTYLNQMYTEHGSGDPSRPLMEDETTALQPSPSTTTTTNPAQTPQRNVWLNKLWPSKINSTNEQDENVA